MSNASQAAVPGFDPIRFELIRNALGTIADEMALTIVRTSRSGVLKDNMDFSTALCAADGQLIAQGLTLPIHLGSMPDAMAALLRCFPAASVQVGDVYILNDPFEGGMHLPDVFIVKPLFVAGELLAYACTVAHQADMGGRVPGSNASDSTEIFAEGLRIPPLYYQQAGQPNLTLKRIIEKNVRVPDIVLSDLASQVAACSIAERELTALAERYGVMALLASFGDLLEHAERLTRAELASWPDGAYTFEDFIDDDGIDDRPILLRVTLTVQGDRLTADFTGTSPQVKGAINATPSFARSAVYLTVRSVMDADVPNNAGYMRPITVVTPAGSIVNPNLPAAFAARGLTGFRLIDTLFGALAQVRPDKVPAACEGGNTGISIGGWDRQTGPFIFVEFVCGTGGARPSLDGVDGHTNPGVCMSNVPCEIVEVESPVVVERYGLVPDSGGPGRFRGGLGLERAFRFVGEEAVLQVRADRHVFRPYGLAGGQAGGPSSNWLQTESGTRELPGKFTRSIRDGDLLHHTQAGGGGFGDPLTRDPGLVLADVLDEKLSSAAANRDYGVVLTEDGRDVDFSATAAVRTERSGGCLSGDELMSNS
jgi:N-methylhydantoinase B